MTLLGITLRPAVTRAMLLGSGEPDKGVTIECQRLSVEMITVNRYANAPTMHIVYHSHVINMLDSDALCRVVELEKPRYIVPEIEAIATGILIRLEEEGLNVVPYARATKLAMNRESIHRLAAEELQLLTSTYRFADSESLFREAVATIGYPCIVKPVTSSSGKGQTFIRSAEQLAHTWGYAQQGGRAGTDRVIVEGIVKFDSEITLLTVSAVGGVHFCVPVSHHQEDGDYHESWQPQQTNPLALEHTQEIVRKVVLALGGYGLLGVELFVYGNGVIFSEVSPRPHDTGMMTLVSQNLSGFALHVRAFLGLPIGGTRQYGPAASTVILPQLIGQDITFDSVQSTVGTDLQIRLFGKPEVDGNRHLEVALATAGNVVDTIERTKHAAGQVKAQG